MPAADRLVSGSGDVKLTKDGCVLLHEMVLLTTSRSLPRACHEPRRHDGALPRSLSLTHSRSLGISPQQIQHPTACMIARAATAQDDITGDGTTSTVLLIGEILKQAERYLAEEVHPRVLAEGFEAAKAEALRVLNEIKIVVDPNDKELLLSVARTSLRTKVCVARDHEGRRSVAHLTCMMAHCAAAGVRARLCACVRVIM